MKLGLSDIKTYNLWRSCAAEFVGTAFFVLCVTCLTIDWSSPTYPPTLTRAPTTVEIALGVGFALFTFMHAFWHVSGGHLNPAVSIAMVTGGRIALVRGIIYVVAQVAGGVVGSALTYICTTNTTTKRMLSVNDIRDNVTLGQGVGLELLFTFVLVFYVFSVTDSAKNIESANAALGTGVTAVVCHICLIPITGCSVNPARSFGPAAISNMWRNHWVFWVAPVSGGILASIFYNLIFYCEDEIAKPREYGLNNVQTNGHAEEPPATLRLESSNL